jgi:hypothetical protein
MNMPVKVRWKPRVRLKRQKHHLRPRRRGGSHHSSNLLVLWNDKHELWHMLWGNRTLEEVIALLTRVARMKRRTR